MDLGTAMDLVHEKQREMHENGDDEIEISSKMRGNDWPVTYDGRKYLIEVIERGKAYAALLDPPEWYKDPYISGTGWGEDGHNVVVPSFDDALAAIKKHAVWVAARMPVPDELDRAILEYDEALALQEHADPDLSHSGGPGQASR